MLNPLQLINPTYLFELRPYTQTANLKYAIFFFALLIIIGIAIKIYKEVRPLEKFQAKLLEKYFYLLTVMGAIGVAMVWLRYERVQILSARFWAIVWLVAVLIWLYPITKYHLKVVPQAKKQAEEKKLFQKYLPRKK
jgi:magnesium-transporting ATPase (P-type)